MASSKTSSNGSTTDTAQDVINNWMSFCNKLSDENMSLFRKSFENAQELAHQNQPQEMVEFWQNGFQDLFERMSQVKGYSVNDPEAYRDSYQKWMSYWSEQFEGMMGSREFAVNTGKQLETITEFKEKMGDFLEEYWHNMHLSTREDMRDVFQKLYTVDRKIDHLEIKVHELSEQIDDLMDLLKATGKPRTTTASSATATKKTAARKASAPRATVKKSSPAKNTTKKSSKK